MSFLVLRVDDSDVRSVSQQFRNDLEPRFTMDLLVADKPFKPSANLVGETSILSDINMPESRLDSCEGETARRTFPSS